MRGFAVALRKAIVDQGFVAGAAALSRLVGCSYAPASKWLLAESLPGRSLAPIVLRVLGVDARLFGGRNFPGYGDG